MNSSPAQLSPPSPESSVEVRERLVEALKLDLVGPWAGHRLERERLPGIPRPVHPSTWYLTGFIVPRNYNPSSREAEELDANDDLDEMPEKPGPSEESTDDGKPARRGYFASSMGLSFLVSSEARDLEVTVRWGYYAPSRIDRATVWSRTPHEESRVWRIPKAGAPEIWAVPNSDGLSMKIVARPVHAGALGGGGNGTLSVSIFLVNERRPRKGQAVDDRLYAFQPEIEVRSQHPFPSRPTLQPRDERPWDDQVADLHYSDTPEYATGHGVSAVWKIVDGECRLLRTAWIGEAEVEVTSTATVQGPDLAMEALGCLDSGDEVHDALDPLVERYRDWIANETGTLDAIPEDHKETATELLRLAGIAAHRIERGISVLAEDPLALDAFRIANRAVARALKRRLSDIQVPKWRAFQLAFILLNLPEIVDPRDSHRKTVDLLFFPTGGGKTEAYLGLAAFTMVLRRLRNPAHKGRAAGGVSVVMRYTLRLLTLDQLARASGLVCALELERRKDEHRYGKWPFEIGLWVGSAATPNWMGSSRSRLRGSAKEKVTQFKSDPGNNPSPIPLEECPWCSTKFDPNSFHLEPDAQTPERLVVLCSDWECDFGDEDCPLPIVAVDEPLYRRLPAFLIATVDKFAALPWTGQSGVLLGGADRYDDSGYYGAFSPRVGTLLPGLLKPPDLIIQDELHLISGPLGSMTGLYEAMIEGLCVHRSGNLPVRPKVIASTATVRQAKDQIQAIFGRSQTQIFPPPGPTRRDSFFASTVSSSFAPARLYLGVSAQGRSAKVVTRRVHVALMGAAMRAYLDAGGDREAKNAADPYMTVLGYFNSLRELGGARRILEEEVQNTIKTIGLRKRHGERRGSFRDRFRFSEVVELTSRVSTNKVAEARRMLGTRFRLKPDKGTKVVDCAIATNMISVGLDIQRLGLMVVVGQPKTASEYIQATSRVGRDEDRPGLVVTLLNMHKPRDRSHYERFKHFHETFYRSVEVASVTPFAARALDRGLAGALVALARHSQNGLTPASAAKLISRFRTDLVPLLHRAFLDRASGQPDFDDDDRDVHLTNIRNRIDDLVDEWARIASGGQSGGGLRYQKYEGGKGKTLLREMLETEDVDERHLKFRANRSLRDVEPQVKLVLVES